MKHYLLCIYHTKKDYIAPHMHKDTYHTTYSSRHCIKNLCITSYTHDSTRRCTKSHTHHTIAPGTITSNIFSTTYHYIIVNTLRHIHITSLHHVSIWVCIIYISQHLFKDQNMITYILVLHYEKPNTTNHFITLNSDYIMWSLQHVYITLYIQHTTCLRHHTLMT